MRRRAFLVTAGALVLAACAPGSSRPGEGRAAPAPGSGPAHESADAVKRMLATMPDDFWEIGSIDAFKKGVDRGAYVIDVREPSEYAAGHVPGAVNIPLRTLTSSLARIPQDRDAVVYCRSSYRAGIATAALRAVDYANVRDFVPSFPGWAAAREPVATDAVVGRTFGAPKADAGLVATVDAWLRALPADLYSAGTSAQLKQAQSSGTAIIVDVREEAEFAEGHITGAVSIPLRRLVTRVPMLPSDGLIALYSMENHRTGMSLAALQLLGIARARGFQEGYAGWKAAGQPTSADSPAKKVGDCD